MVGRVPFCAPLRPAQFLTTVVSDPRLSVDLEDPRELGLEAVPPVKTEVATTHGVRRAEEDLVCAERSQGPFEVPEEPEADREGQKSKGWGGGTSSLTSLKKRPCSPGVQSRFHPQRVGHGKGTL